MGAIAAVSSSQQQLAAVSSSQQQFAAVSSSLQQLAAVSLHLAPPVRRQSRAAGLQRMTSVYHLRVLRDALVSQVESRIYHLRRSRATCTASERAALWLEQSQKYEVVCTAFFSKCSRSLNRNILQYNWKIWHTILLT